LSPLPLIAPVVIVQIQRLEKVNDATYSGIIISLCSRLIVIGTRIITIIITSTTTTVIITIIITIIIIIIIEANSMVLLGKWIDVL
jgi:hypothetical protein